MSFGFSIGDFVLLTQLALKIVQNSRQACGAHDELTREVTSLHLVLQRLQLEVANPTSIINRINDGRREELRTIVGGCDRQLKVLDQVLTKYNGLSEETRRTTKLWQKIKFGNGEMKDLGKIRQELATHTAAITLLLNLLSMGSQGRVEEYMENHSAEMRELRSSLNWISASLQAGSPNREGSILTSYGDDDKKIWKEFRRELLVEGFSSSVLRRNKNIIKDYVLELGARGALDTPENDNVPVMEGNTEVEEQDYAEEGNSGSPSETEDEEQAQENPTAVAEPNSSTSSSRRSSPSGSFQVTVAEFLPADLLEFQNATRGTRAGAKPNTESNNFATIVVPSSTRSLTKESTRLLPMRTSAKPEPVSMAEIEDEDFMVGAHPNCGPDEDSDGDSYGEAEAETDEELDEQSEKEQHVTKDFPNSQEANVVYNYSNIVKKQFGFDPSCRKTIGGKARKGSPTRNLSSHGSPDGSTCANPGGDKPAASSSYATGNQNSSGTKTTPDHGRSAPNPKLDGDKEYAAEYRAAAIRTASRWDVHKDYVSDCVEAARRKATPIEEFNPTPLKTHKDYAAEYMRAARRKAAPAEEFNPTPTRRIETFGGPPWNYEICYVAPPSPNLSDEPQATSGTRHTIDNGQSAPEPKPHRFNPNTLDGDGLNAPSNTMHGMNRGKSSWSAPIMGQDRSMPNIRDDAGTKYVIVNGRSVPVYRGRFEEDGEQEYPHENYVVDGALHHIPAHRQHSPSLRAQPADVTVDEDEIMDRSTPYYSLSPTDPPTMAPPGEAYGFAECPAPSPRHYSRHTNSGE